MEDFAADEERDDFAADFELVRNFTWSELLDYNIEFLKGERQGTFYHAAPLYSDQVPEDLIAITKRGMFTTDGQGTELDSTTKQKAYLYAYIPLSLAEQVIRGVRLDDDVVCEIRLIRRKQTIYVSDELATLHKNRDKFSLTQDREEESESWRQYTNYWGNTETLSDDFLMEQLTRWDEWVHDGLCFLFIADKEYGQAPKSMPGRILGYLDAKSGGTRRRRKQKKKSRKF